MKTDDGYWGKKYVNYWKEKVTDANQGNTSSTTTDRTYFDLIEQLNPTGKTIEIGCGFGRSISLLEKYTHEITAIDISDDMLDEAKKNNPVSAVEFIKSQAEQTPFPDNNFDTLICFAVFDCLDQPKAWKEFLRILKPGGKLLITGKNDSYCADDDEALIAEIRARKNRHPNSFTNITELLSSPQDFGINIKLLQSFERRGDMNNNIRFNQTEAPFYEYALFAEKNLENKVKSISSSFMSKTFKSLVLDSLEEYM